MRTTAAKGDLNNGPSQKKMDENGNRVVNDEPFIDKRKQSSTLAVKGVLNNGEHTLIPVRVNDSFCRMRLRTVCLERRPTASHGEACGCC